MAKKKKEVKKSEWTETPFGATLKFFLTQIEGLEKSVIAILLMQKLHEKETKELEEFIDKKGQNIRKKSGTTYFKLDPVDRGTYEKIKQERNKSKTALEALPRALFVSLVSQYDLIVASLIKAILKEHPTIISPEKSLSFEEIQFFDSIDDIVEYLVEEEVDSILFKSHNFHIEWIEKKTGVELSVSLKEEIPCFTELTERRNLFVHANGIANRKYIRNCKDINCPHKKGLKQGKQLDVNSAYFRDSYECLYKISVKMTYLIWEKLNTNKDEVEEANTFFNNDIIVDLIKHKKYELADDLLSFAAEHFVGVPEIYRKLFTINRALVNKLAGKEDIARKIIGSTDWTAAGNELRLAVAILEDRFEDAFKLMRKIGKEGEFIGKENYHEDPLYEPVRQRPEFAKVYREIYGTDFVSAVKILKK
ncbi:MAG: hypothetical protein PHD04_02365 [Candidatus Pacebacteria bacterium]|nr:hypothetical protein [Candidatus Paceibacterota bacterium]